jgi:DNA-binding NtrC family response regulator
MVGVLLVEDDTDIANVYALKLRLDGYSVMVAAGHEEAIQSFLARRPAVVCLDAWLPDGAGTDLAEQFAMAGARIVLFTNDEATYASPPACVCRSLLKARTNPAKLSATIRELVGAAPAGV